MAQQESVIAVFPDRSAVETAVDELIGVGLDRSQVSLLASNSPVEEIKHADSVAVPTTDTPLDRADKGNMQGILGGIPTYVAAVLAAGVTVASGGTLAGVALATLGAGAAGGLLGIGAAKVFGDAIDARYEDQLARGGIVVIVSPFDDAQAARAEEILRSHGAEHVGRHHTHDAPIEATGPVTDSSAWTG